MMRNIVVYSLVDVIGVDFSIVISPEALMV